MSTYPTTVRARASAQKGRTVAIWAALAAALIGTVLVLALTVADDNSPSRSVIDGAQSRPIGPNTRFDGGPNEGTRGTLLSQRVDSPVIRFDGGPQEGTRGAIVRSNPVQAPTFDRGPRAGTRFDGGPNEGTRGAAVEYSASTRFDGGPDEGTRGAVVLYNGSTRFDGGPDEGTRGR
jgi:hypothetical protein